VKLKLHFRVESEAELVPASDMKQEGGGKAKAEPKTKPDIEQRKQGFYHSPPQTPAKVTRSKAATCCMVVYLTK
jgi:hypothetical protein